MFEWSKTNGSQLQVWGTNKRYTIRGEVARGGAKLLDSPRKEIKRMEKQGKKQKDNVVENGRTVTTWYPQKNGRVWLSPHDTANPAPVVQRHPPPLPALAQASDQSPKQPPQPRLLRRQQQQ